MYKVGDIVVSKDKSNYKARIINIVYHQLYGKVYETESVDGTPFITPGICASILERLTKIDIIFDRKRKLNKICLE